MHVITTEEETFVPTPNYWKGRYQNIGKVYSFGMNNFGQLGLGDTTKRTSFTQVGSATDWKQVAVSRHGNCTFALNNNGDLYDRPPIRPIRHTSSRLYSASHWSRSSESAHVAVALPSSLMSMTTTSSGLKKWINRSEWVATIN